jgi:hypothetical protein
MSDAAGEEESLVKSNLGPVLASASVEISVNCEELSAVVIVEAAVAVKPPVILIPVAVVASFANPLWYLVLLIRCGTQ